MGSSSSGSQFRMLHCNVRAEQGQLQVLLRDLFEISWRVTKEGK